MSNFIFYQLEFGHFEGKFSAIKFYRIYTVSGEAIRLPEI